MIEYEVANDILDALRKQSVADRRSARRLQNEIDFGRDLLAIEFGKRNGWKLGRPFTAEQLARGGCRARNGERWFGFPFADHPYFYKVGRRPVAVAAHNYGEVDLDQFEEYGLTAREITDFPSWHYPKLTRLVLVRSANPVG